MAHPGLWQRKPAPDRTSARPTRPSSECVRIDGADPSKSPRFARLSFSRRSHGTKSSLVAVAGLMIDISRGLAVSLRQKGPARGKKLGCFVLLFCFLLAWCCCCCSCWLLRPLSSRWHLFASLSLSLSLTLTFTHPHSPPSLLLSLLSRLLFAAGWSCNRRCFCISHPAPRNLLPPPPFARRRTTTSTTTTHALNFDLDHHHRRYYDDDDDDDYHHTDLPSSSNSTYTPPSPRRRRPVRT